jgi:hypothetical protein
MDAKAGMMIFGVVLLLAAIFFFFKSFASHENRTQEEQRARIELERMKLEAERNATRRPLTPEEMARRRRMEEERQKADAAKRALAAEQRKAWQQEEAHEPVGREHG